MRAFIGCIIMHQLLLIVIAREGVKQATVAILGVVLEIASSLAGLAMTYNEKCRFFIVIAREGAKRATAAISCIVLEIASSFHSSQ